MGVGEAPYESTTKKGGQVLNELTALLLLALAAAAWVRYAEHPTARNLRVAIADTLGL